MRKWREADPERARERSTKAMREWRAANPERAREASRLLYAERGNQRSPEHERERGIKRRAKEGFSEKHRLERQRYRERHPEKHAAQSKVSDAIRRGKLVRQPCEVCGAESAEAHHDDYSKPLDVRWLCKEHHRLHHHSHRPAS